MTFEEDEVKLGDKDQDCSRLILIVLLRDYYIASYEEFLCSIPTERPAT